MKISVVLAFILCSICSVLHAQKPISDLNGTWNLLTDYSDEFNSTSLDVTKWDNNINNFGVWTWDSSNVYLSNGTMHIRMVNEQNVSGGVTYYFKSGAVRQKKEITYGYFEAKVKGCPKWPGVCPAFWMYSVAQPVTNGVKYNEIDFMEIQQRQFNIKTIDCNLHLERIINGAVVRTDPPTVYNAPFAPNDGFHIYGCNVTPSLITFYIDGIEVGTQVNDYFILPMRVILSMGLRPPLMRYLTGGGREPIEILNEPGFPTEMEVDYVRVWQKPGVAILPIKLTSFTGKILGKRIQTQWTTAAEINNDKFEIQKSNDGKSFLTIGLLKGAGSSNIQNNYSFIDENPLAGTNYYRLKQFDFDGTTAYSDVIAVKSNISETTLSINVSTTLLNVQIVSSNSSGAKLYLFDVNGIELIEQDIYLTQGINVLNINKILSSGIYFFKLLHNGKVITKKFVVL